MLKRFTTLRSALIASVLALMSGCSGDDSSDSNAGMPADATVRKYTYEDENIVYSGRFLFEDGKPPKFSAPAANISARFKGTAVSMRLHDYASTANFFDIVIDGDYANAKKVQPDPLDLTPIVDGLPYAEHTVTIIRRTEASTGQTDFRGLDITGEILPPPPERSRRIIIVGDSISAGSGNEAVNDSADCALDYGRPFSNAGKAWGPVLARRLDAEYHVTAVPGIGVIRNYNCNDEQPMPAVYDRMFLELGTSPEWDHAGFDPDAILIMLGTNDFSPGSCMNPPLNATYDAANYQLFVSEFEAFVERLRGLHADAEIFVLSSPMLNDGWPSDDPELVYTSDTDQRAAITQVVENLEKSGAAGGKVHLVLADYDSSRYSGRGCGTHPNAFEHSLIAGLDTQRPDDPTPPSLILDPVREVMGW